MRIRDQNWPQSRCPVTLGSARMTSLLLPACVAWCVVTVGALACDGDRENCPAEAPKAAPADSARFKPPAFTPFTMPLPTLEEFESYVYVESVFSAEECKTIRRMGRSAKLQPGGVVDGQGKNIRQTNVSWLFTDKQVLPTLAADRPSADWIFGRLAAAVASANERHWKMDLSGFLEPLQFTQYQAPSAHYDFHRDSGRGRFSLRKVSLVVLLSKPSEFEGGDLELVDGKGGYTLPKKQGGLILFPSYVVHRVTHVTKGIRHSLVGWVSGPPLR